MRTTPPPPTTNTNKKEVDCSQSKNNGIFGSTRITKQTFASHGRDRAGPCFSWKIKRVTEKKFWGGRGANPYQFGWGCLGVAASTSDYTRRHRVGGRTSEQAAWAVV